MITAVHHPKNNGKPWKFDPDWTYDQRLGPKPQGLWLSIDDDWRRWCEGEEWNLPLADPVEFSLDTDRCLWLSSHEDIDAFSEEYVGDGTIDAYRVDWQPLVDGGFAGIIIAPYIWSQRLSMGKSGWYYGWDCASACVWDLSCLKEAS